MPNGRFDLCSAFTRTLLLQLVGKQMVGIYLSIWVRRALLKQIRGVQVTSIGTGIMGYLGNKGATPAEKPT